MLKVSIIVPVHNSETTLIRCVDSIINQGYEDLECILVENGSNDKSAEFCQALASKYNNIIYSTIENGNVSRARNRGLDLATGDIIGFCDADDFLEKRTIETVVREFYERPQVISVFTGFYIGKEINGDILKKYKGTKRKMVSPIKALELVITDDSVMGSMWNKYYRANLVKNIRFDDKLSYCEDTHFNAKALSEISSCNGIVKILSYPSYCYMDNPKSLTHDKNNLYDENNELKYNVSLKKIIEDCRLSSKIKKLVKMKLVCLSVDNVNISSPRNEKIVSEIATNYKYLIRYCYKNNLIKNIFRLIKGGMLLVSMYNKNDKDELNKST